MNPELVLVVGDMFLPQRSPDINEQFKAILTPNKVQHVLCLGNIGNQETYDWLKSLSKDFHIVKGDFDQDDAPEKKMIQIGDFNIGLIHGHQVLPWGDLESLGMVQRSLGCDILISGHTHKTNVVVKDNILYINPGSFSGAFSPLIEDTIPSFVLMVLTGDEAIVYLYTLSDRSKKFEVNKYDYKKGADNLFHVENEEDEEEKKEEEDDLDKKDENQQEQEQGAEPEQEQEQDEIKDDAE
jgi:vacuolar protein sorting-associated protein 29